MKRIITTISAAIFAALSLNAQVYFSADGFPLYGKALENTSERYTRFPAELKDSIRKELWDLSQDSAGMCVRFRTNSTSVSAKWTNIYGTSMNHMTATGIRGIDLYVWEDGKWQHVRCGQPSTKKETTKQLISGMTPEMREFTVYLPLYDGIRDFEIGIDSTAVIEQPQLNSPTREKPIVMYGTSILQGGCVTRPGMASTNIIERRLHREVINLAFSGNGRLDLEVARIMAAIPDPGVYVMDNLPNCTAERVKTATLPFINILRKAHPDTPIIFVENPYYTYAHYSGPDYDRMVAANGELKKIFDQLKKDGWKNIYYVKGDHLNGDDREGTIDGAHFTDLGMLKYCDILIPVIKKALKK